MSGKKILIIALALGLLTSYLAWSYVDGATKASRVQYGPVVVAAVNVPARTIVQPSMLKVIQIPLDARHPEAFTNPADVKEKIPKQALVAGEQLLSSKFFLQREDSGLAFMIPPSKRAVSVGLSEVIGSGGLILPGDSVDVIAVFENRGQDGARDRDSATTVLQDVLVLAVAQQLEGQEPPKGQLQRGTDSIGLGARPAANTPPRVDPANQPTAKSVTLAVNPEEAQRLVLAEERGKIRLALRPANDRSAEEIREVTLAAVQGNRR